MQSRLTVVLAEAVVASTHFWQIPHASCEVPATRSPIFHPCSSAPGPSATISPAHSCPGVNGKLSGQKPGSLPYQVHVGAADCDTARTRARISLRPGLGVGIRISNRLGFRTTSASIVGGILAAGCVVRLRRAWHLALSRLRWPRVFA